MPKDVLVQRLEGEGFAATAGDFEVSDGEAARRQAKEAADKVERFGYRDDHAAEVATELRRWANLTRP